MALSKKQKIFVEEYLKCWNATQAAIKAGYAEKSARQTGHRLITDDYISEIIKERVAEKVMSADEALQLLSDQARVSLEDVADVGEDGRWTFNFIKAKENGKLHLIKGIVPTAYGTKVELHSSQRALELIGKAHGMFTDNIKHEVVKPVIVEHRYSHEETEEEEDGVHGGDEL